MRMRFLLVLVAHAVLGEGLPAIITSTDYSSTRHPTDNNVSHGWNAIQVMRKLNMCS